MSSEGLFATFEMLIERLGKVEESTKTLLGIERDKVDIASKGTELSLTLFRGHLSEGGIVKKMFSGRVPAGTPIVVELGRHSTFSASESWCKSTGRYHKVDAHVEALYDEEWLQRLKKRCDATSEYPASTHEVLKEGDPGYGSGRINCTIDDHLCEMVLRNRMPEVTLYTMTRSALLLTYEKEVGVAESRYLMEVLSRGAIDDMLNTAEKQGYEGIMVRASTGIYELGKRSAMLLKYKRFSTDEFIIRGFREAAGRDRGTPVFEFATATGLPFAARPVGTLSERRALFDTASTLIGKPMTIKFQGLSRDGIPRFPVALGVRDYE
ncbi:hypothetical protein TSOC_000525 [Tetrabaena socialis]|uniref:ATP-dependent DNA ligase family profile domain-containing protein n=1 Tax=Tetrabaena socialis TaxID=47790 RepID=A0A2J8AJ26_9CHLO|nr:hypothetical protein TSOC_000525 [Tetrabaena socialis]|eukprot:PNH12526.1 hypothetical protein TSOC_000525 [Tetrabaena socialis]